MDASISDGELQREVIELYGERYSDMTLNDWRHIIEAYTPMVRNASDHKAKEVSMQAEQFGMAAEPSVKRDEE
jgi:type I restriction enzyme R subunit